VVKNTPLKNAGHPVENILDTINSETVGQNCKKLENLATDSQNMRHSVETNIMFGCLSVKMWGTL
jgi:hypothetical protein